MASLTELFDKLLEPVAKLTGVERLAGTVAAVARVLVDGKMWRSLGWLLLGLLLLLAGILLLLRRPLEAAAGTAVKAAAL